MEKVIRQLRCHHYPRMLGVRVVFYLLLVSGVFTLLVYTSALASVSVHITFTAAASRKPVARTWDPPPTRAMGASPRSQQGTDANKNEMEAMSESSINEDGLVILEFEDFATIDSNHLEEETGDSNKLSITSADTNQVDKVSAGNEDFGHHVAEIKELGVIQTDNTELGDKQADTQTIDDKVANPIEMDSGRSNSKELQAYDHLDKTKANLKSSARLFVDTDSVISGSKRTADSNVSASQPKINGVKDGVSNMADPELKSSVLEKSSNSKRWQKIVKNGNWIIYGAYFNRRYIGLGKVVQVIVVRKEKAKGHGSWSPGLTFTCTLLYPGKKAGLYTTVTVQSTVFYLWSGHHNTKYRPGHLCCKLPDSRLPEAISITSGNLEEPLNQVKINYEQLEENPRSFTLCLSPLHFTTNVDKTLVQYFELNKLLGADFYYVYNYKVTDKTQKVIDFYSERNNTRVIPWHLPVYLRGEEYMWYFAQTIALNDCFLRSKGNTEYLITTDLDEFILPRAPSLTWKEMLEKESVACTYNLNCVVVDMTRKVSAIKNDARKRIGQKFGLFTLLNQAKHTSLIAGRVKSKYIVKPSCYDGINVHTPMNMSNERGEESLNYVRPENAVMYHYASPDAKFIDETSRNDADVEKTVMRFASALIKRVGAVWKKLVQFKP